MTLVTKSSDVDGAFVPLGCSTDILENRNPSNPAISNTAKGTTPTVPPS